MNYSADVSLTSWLTLPKPLLVSGDAEQSQTGAMFSDQNILNKSCFIIKQQPPAFLQSITTIIRLSMGEKTRPAYVPTAWMMQLQQHAYSYQLVEKGCEHIPQPEMHPITFPC